MCHYLIPHHSPPPLGRAGRDCFVLRHILKMLKVIFVFCYLRWDAIFWNPENIFCLKLGMGCHFWNPEIIVLFFCFVFLFFFKCFLVTILVFIHR